MGGPAVRKLRDGFLLSSGQLGDNPAFPLKNRNASLSLPTFSQESLF